MRGLVLSGGAVKGAYEVGALQYLINDLGLQYDVLTGVSVGALNCSYLSMFPKAQERDAFTSLFNLWHSIDNSKVRKNWFPFGWLTGLWKDSVYNSQPLIDMVHSTLDLNKIRASGRQIVVGAVSLTSGNYTRFSQKDDSFIDAVLASSSFPMGLNPIKIGSELYTDGGVKHITPLKEAIDLGCDDLDVIICGPTQTSSSFSDVDAITLGLRCFDLMTDQTTEADIQLAKAINRIVELGGDPNHRYLNIKVVRPKVNIQASDLDFNQANIQAMIAQGYKEAKEQYQA